MKESFLRIAEPHFFFFEYGRISTRSTHLASDIDSIARENKSHAENKNQPGGDSVSRRATERRARRDDNSRECVFSRESNFGSK